MYLKRKKPPSDGYAFNERTCPVCGKHFMLATFHQYAYTYRRRSGDWKHNIFVCSYTCDLRLSRGEFDDCLVNGTMPY